MNIQIKAKTCFQILVVAIGILTFVGCTKSCSQKPGSESTGDSTAVDNKPKRPSYDGISVKRIVKRDLVIGKGQTVKPSSEISYKQKTWIYDTKKPANQGQLVNASGDKADGVQLGTGNVIRGIEQGVVGMKKGGKRQLIIPPEHAYGDKGMPPHVFPGAILLVDIEVIDVK
jgi:FKBP-type peptidyl-prolyl cis-trans isomerase FkpA